VVVAVNSVCAAGLYALDEFLLPTFSQAFRAAAPLCALPFLGAGYATIETLALLAVVGEAARSVLLATVVRRRSRALAGGEAVPEGVTSVWRAMAPHAINMVIVAVNPVVDRAVASSLAPGSVTVIDLAEKVSYVPTLILMSSVVLVAGARWSAAFERPSDLLKDYRRTTRLALAASSVLAIVFGACVVVLGLVSGPKTAGADTALLVTVTLVLLVGLPGAAVASLGSRLLTSTQRTAMLPAFAVSAFVLNLVGDIVGARLFGPIGIAGATVVMRSVNAALFVVYATRLVAGLSATRSTRTRGDAQAPRLAAEATQ
jgi:putative peptidoglycan lipid II flippase